MNGFWLYAIDWLIRLGLSARVIMRRRPVGVTLAWLVIVLAAPVVGALVYLLVGELRLGRDRAARARWIHEPYARWLRGLPDRYPLPIDPDRPEPALARLIQAGIDIPVLPGNELTLLSTTDAIFERLIADIDATTQTCHLAFYIWQPGGWGDRIADAVQRAAGRGVDCRVLLDAIGSAAFFKSTLVPRLRAAGVEVVAALPARPWRFLFERLDLRLHRKIAVFDNQVAYTGSMNLVDPRLFKQGAGVGHWIDAMARLRGPAVEALTVTFIEDWELETGSVCGTIDRKPNSAPQPLAGASFVQVVPSGPTSHPALMKAVLLQTIYEARQELILTTPYFVPDEALVTALASAALRGVAVHLVVPAKNDSKLVDLASRAFEGDLAEAGVKIHLFEGGLLHTKSITADGQMSLFGSLNLDPRSLALNFEITLAVYDPDFTARLCALQRSYIADSRDFDLTAWRTRPWGTRFAENTARLAGPLL
ncbi:MAG: cardiolipin synthase A [Isosphaeraceae bacterium]|nr:MAG: cardiolipin synthase A [Isosphaeraceae bacterium]